MHQCIKQHFAQRSHWILQLLNPLNPLKVHLKVQIHCYFEPLNFGEQLQKSFCLSMIDVKYGVHFTPGY